ncbi:amidase [Achromobacter insolitus]|uniref:amidase n=1 Tax=Achromobacter insolitus TaxID=217204 RepID=UPI003B9C66D9
MPAQDNALHFQDALALASGIRRRELSSRQVTTHFLDRIERAPALAAYSEVTAERALAQADAADRLRDAGILLGPLHGVPVAVKDSVQWEGVSASLGSRALQGRISSETAAPLRMLAARGMVVLGKTRMTEFAFGLSGQNPTQGTARNPWDARLARAPGGSSSGAGVAVAAGLAPLALGGDTGGSVRAPAALNGVVGYKPSSGVISRAGCLPLSDTLDVLGPITRNVADARLLTQLLAGPDIDDTATLDLPAGAIAALRRPAVRTPGPIAVLAPEAWPASLADAGQRAWHEAQEALARAGYTPTPWHPPATLSFARMADDNSLVLAYEAYRYYGTLAEDAAQPLWDVVRKRIAAGGRIAQADYKAALQRRAADMVAFAQAMQGHDALLMPACDQAAQALDADDTRHAGLGKLLRPANFLGAAAISLPAGFDAEGMPMAVQLLAPAGADAALLDCAAALEPVLAPATRRPDLSEWGL